MFQRPAFSRRIARAAAALGLLAVLRPSCGLAVKTAHAELSPGLFVSIKGEFADGGFIARSVSLAGEQVESIRGPVESVDEAAGRLRIGTFDIALGPKSDVQDAEGQEIGLADLQRGQAVKVSFERRDSSEASARVVDKVKLRAEGSEYVRMEGAIEQMFPQGPAGTRFVVLGVTVMAGIDTQWEGVRPPRAMRVVNDDDRRPADAIRLGKAGWLSGEAAFEFREQQDSDLTNLLQDGSQRARLRTDLEWTLPATKHVSGMAEVKLLREWVLVDDSDSRSDKTDVLLGETWIQLMGIMTKRGALQLGRLDWDDEREWWFRRDMDTLRLSSQWAHWSLAVAVSQQTVDPETDLTDARHLLLEARWTPEVRHRVALYALDRADWYRYDAVPPSVVRRERDFEPRHYGFHAEGEGKKLWSYWVDAAIARGSLKGEQLNGHAYDLGVQLTWDTIVQPTIVVGYAMGSGDSNPADDDHEEFRQTGLHENNGKWNGVTSFRYYGEVLRPELSNIHIETIGFGLHLPDEWSVDFAWHGYRLDEFASELTDSSAGDERRLNLVSKDLGEEWDIIVGYEGLGNWEFELSLGQFEPGDAWLGPLDSASSIYFKTKYIF